MTDYKTKIWLGIGVCTFLGAGDIGHALADTSMSNVPMVQLAAAEGGEGGESGGSGVSVADEEGFIYMTHLYEMEGVMRAGRELYESGNQEGALAQFNYLLTLFKGKEGDVLMKLGFDRDHVLAEAEQIPQAITDKESYEEFLHIYGHVLRELDEHGLNVEATERRAPAFVAAVSADILQELAKAYATQDTQKQAMAGGLALIVRDLIGWTASEMRKIDTKAFTKTIMALDELCDALPINGPYEAEPSKIYGLSAKVEFAMSKLH